MFHMKQPRLPNVREAGFFVAVEPIGGVVSGWRYGSAW